MREEQEGELQRQAPAQRVQQGPPERQEPGRQVQRPRELRAQRPRVLQRQEERPGAVRRERLQLRERLGLPCGDLEARAADPLRGPAAGVG